MGSDLEGQKEQIAKLAGQLQVVETKLDRALYREPTHLEARVRRVEKHVGIKTK